MEEQNGDNDYMKLVAVRDIEKGEEVLSMPEEVGWFMENVWRMFAELEELAVALKARQEYREEVFAGYGVALAYLTWPAGKELPLAFETLPRRCESGSDLWPDVVKAFPSVAYKYDHWDDVMHAEKKYWEDMLSGLPTRLHLSFNDYRWGMCLIRTRSFLDHFMVPIADLMTHSFDHANLDWRRRPKAGLVFTAARAIQKGEELIISYGCHTKLSMLCTYGFATQGEPSCNRVHVSETLSLVVVNGDASRVNVETIIPFGTRTVMTSSHQKTPGTHELDIDAGEEVIYLAQTRSWAEVDVPRTGQRGWVPREHMRIRGNAFQFLEPELLLVSLRAGLGAYPPLADDDINAEVKKVREANMQLIQRAIQEVTTTIAKSGEL